MATALLDNDRVNIRLLRYATIEQGVKQPIPRQRLDEHVTANTQQHGEMCILCGPCREVILKTTGATQAVSCWQFPSECQTLRTDQLWN
jgi:hypothetical protein